MPVRLRLRVLINKRRLLNGAFFNSRGRVNEFSIKYSDPAKQARYDKAYLRMAQEWSNLSHCTRKKVGALIVRDGQIIADGYNGSPSGMANDCEDAQGDTHWYVLHAEANAIMKVARSTNSALNSTLYLTLSPCRDCCKLIHQAGIKRLVYRDRYRDEGGLQFLESVGVETVQIEQIAL